ncbi:hypothetical protein BGX26_001403 [Mortierella sp. AD094]|nr:hypothetical protein BGX26_001403 [Mortierella sp. AD094]
METYLTRSLSIISWRLTRLQAISLDRDKVLSGLEKIASSVPALISPSLKDVSETSPPPASPIHSTTLSTTVYIGDLRKIYIFGFPKKKAKTPKPRDISSKFSATAIPRIAQILPFPDLILGKLSSLMGPHESVPLLRELEEMDKMAEDVYVQIERLSKLEGLSIGCDFDEV